jgi:O-antigen/teichoic acid export membrane protein
MRFQDISLFSDNRRSERRDAVLGGSRLVNQVAVRHAFGQLGWVGGSQLLTAGARFLILVITARALPPREFGNFAFFSGCALTIGGLAELSLGKILVRCLAVALGQENLRSAKEAWSTTFQVKFLLSAAILSTGLLIVRTTSFVRTGDLVQWALVVGVITSLSPLMAAVFQAQGKFSFYFFAYSIDAIRLVVILLFMAFGELSLRRILFTYLLSPCLLAFLWPAMGFKVAELFQPVAERCYRELFSYGKWVFLIAPLESLWPRLDVIMLGMLAGPTEVGIYSGVYVFMGVAALVSTSVTTIIYPRMTNAFERQSKAGLAAEYIRSTNVMAYLGLPCVLGVASLGPVLIEITVGKSYLTGLGLLPFLAIYGVFLILQMNTGAVFWSIGKPEFSFYWNLAIVASDVIGNELLIPSWHAKGAACALAVSSVVGALLSWAGVFHCVGVWPNFRKIGLYLFSAGLMYIAVWLLPVTLSGGADLLIRVAVGAIAYLSAIKVIHGGALAPLADLAESC